MKVLIPISALLIAAPFLPRFLPKRRTRRFDNARLYELAQSEDEQLDSLEESVSGDWSNTEVLTRILGDRLGRAGFIGAAERKSIKRRLFSLVFVGAVLSFLFTLKYSLLAAFAAAFAASYLGFMSCLFYLRHCTAEFQRKVLFQLPLTLETLILLVEAGLGILPAIEQIVRTELARVNGQIEQLSPVAKVLRIIYAMASHGMPFASALELVADTVDIKPLRHVLLHLDVSSAEGGALSPSLRSLSEHTHTEWKLSVESRVKRLETAVVFPVFLSVMGLMMLTASVPLVPVLDFFSSIESRKSIPVIKNSITEGSKNPLVER